MNQRQRRHCLWFLLSVGAIPLCAVAQDVKVAPDRVPDKDGILRPVLIFDLQPHYTKRAFKQGIEGVVKLTCTVGEDGVPKDIKVVRRLDPGLDASAIDALGKWRFEPAKKGGHAVEYQATINTTFKIEPGNRHRKWFDFEYD